MKSSLKELESRGYLTDEAFEKYKQTGNIDELIQSEIAVERTAGARLMSLNREKGFLKSLCDMLVHEKKLYTKIEISETIAGYGSAAVPYLLSLLGRIGVNQHKVPANVDTGKKSYPLPRDIAARVLVKIGPDVLKHVSCSGFNINDTGLPELIDVIGHISFNYRDYSCEKMLLELYRENRDDLIRWKLVRAFQAFSSEEVKGLLKEVMGESGNKIFVKEAERSLSRIEERSA